MVLCFVTLVTSLLVFYFLFSCFMFQIKYSYLGAISISPISNNSGKNEIKENALYHITPDYSISMLDEWRRHETDTCYLAEASPEKTDYINGLLRMQVVDEIILYTVPFIAGTGKYFFRSALPLVKWTLVSQKKFPNGVTCHIYNRMTSERTA